jgi:hypothetical protein
MGMAVKKGKGRKKDKVKKARDVLALLVASVETMSAKLDKLEKLVDSSRPEPKRQGIRSTRADTVPERSKGAPAARAGRGRPVTKKKATRKKSVAAKTVGKKAISKKTAASKAAAKKGASRKKAVARNVTGKKTLQRRATAKKVATKRTRTGRK